MNMYWYTILHCTTQQLTDLALCKQAHENSRCWENSSVNTASPWSSLWRVSTLSVLLSPLILSPVACRVSLAVSGTVLSMCWSVARCLPDRELCMTPRRSQKSGFMGCIVNNTWIICFSSVQSKIIYYFQHSCYNTKLTQTQSEYYLR